jgi:uncharacterized protein DUF4412
MRISGITVTALLAGSTLSLAAHAGVYLESTDKSVGSPAEKPSVSKMWFDGGRMRTERLQPDGDSQIVVFKSQSMYMLEPKSKSYRVIDKATAERMGAQVAEAKKKMDERLAAMSPEQRQKMQDLVDKMGSKGGSAMAGLTGAKPPERTVKNTGRTETVAGIKCTIWEATVNGKKEEELCAAPAAAMPGGDEIMKTFRDIATMLSSFTQSFGGSGDNQPWRDMEKINGVPILTRDFNDGKVETEMRLTAVRKESVPGASFEVPAGYTEKKMSFGAAAP